MKAKWREAGVWMLIAAASTLPFAVSPWTARAQDGTPDTEKDANKAVDFNNYIEGALDAMEAVELDPKLAEEYLKQTLPMISDADHKYGAFALLTGVAGMQPKNARVLLQLAKAQSKTSHSAEAIATYAIVLQLDPKYTLDALRGRADAIAYASQPYNAAQWLPAVDDLKLVSEANSKDIPTLLQLIKAQYNAGLNADAIKNVQRVLALEPNNAYAHVMLGLGLALNGDQAGATTEVKTWINKLKPEENQNAIAAIGGAVSHYQKNEALKAIYLLVPKSDNDKDDDDDENANPYFV